MTTIELLDKLPEGITILNDHHNNELVGDEIWYAFDLGKEDGKYELSYYSWLKDESLISFDGNLHEVVSNMYEWCKDSGYIKDEQDED